MKRTRLLLLDDHTLFRDSLARLLEFEEDFEIVGLCGKASEAHDLLKVFPVDVILLDFDLGEQQGNAFLATARNNGFAGRVLLVTAGIRDTDATFALARGVSGVFLKHDSPAKLVEAIRLVAAGGVWLNPELIQNLANKTSTPTDTTGRLVLTSREQQVLNGVFAGLANKEIAGQLAVSESSVKATLQQLFDKCKVRTRSQLVRVALQQSLSTTNRTI